METLVIFIYLVIIISAFSIPVWYFTSGWERRHWNGGICPRCGHPLGLYESDATGTDRWICPICGYSTFVTHKNKVYNRKS